MRNSQQNLIFFRFFPMVLIIILFTTSAFAEIVDKKWSYIQNSEIKLGVMTNYGAVIGYFSEISPEINFVNYMDAGREIQQSYYGWEDGSSWAHGDWRWNPVQGGSYVGHKPKLLNFVNENNTIYARSNPRNWVGTQLIENCFMEEWITLSGNVAHIIFRMTYSGPSNGPMHDQELPAVFLDANYDRLTFCTENPWSYNSVTNFRPAGIPSGNPWPNNRAYRTERWSAFVKNGWGMGVYTPATELIGFYWISGGGNDGSGCSHFSPLGTFPITTNFTYQYDAYLTIGMTNEIRQAFYNIYDGIINPGFETGTYTNWTTSGTAWGAAPVTTNFIPNNFEHNGLEGKYYASSLSGGETATGILRSENFTLKKDEQLSFLISGHSTHFAPAEYNYILLCKAADDTELDKVWTPNSDSLHTKLLSHSTNIDLEVYIKVVDDCTEGGWAWLAVDDFNKVGFDAILGQNNGFEIGDFSDWTVGGTAFGSAPVTTNYIPYFFEDCGLDGKFYANSMVGTEAAIGSLTSPSFFLPENASIKFLIGGWAAYNSTNKVYNYVSLKLVSDDSEVDRIYAPGSNFLQEKSFETASAYDQEVYIEVIDNCTSGSFAWLSVDNFQIITEPEIPDIKIKNTDFASPAVPVGSGSKTVNNWNCKGDVGLTNMSSQISPLSGQTIFINGSELFQTFEGVKLKTSTVYRLTFDSYSIGSEQTIKAGLGYGINSGENSGFVAPIAAENVTNINEGTGGWLGNDFASGALFTNVLNPSANDPAISHIFTFETPENLDYTRISCDLGVRFWDASGSQIQLDNVIVTNFSTFPEPATFLIFNFIFLIYFSWRNSN